MWDRRLPPWIIAAALLGMPVLPAWAGGPISSGMVQPGAIAPPTYGEIWTFTGTAGDRVLIAAVTTTGTLNTVITLRAPSGTSEVSTAADRVDHVLGSTGVYTITIEDQGLDNDGSYNLGFLDVTSGPLTSGGDPDGGAIVSAQILSGQIDAPADFDAFTFTGSIGDRVLIAGVATGALPFNTVVYLYPPGGRSTEGITVMDRLDLTLATTGTYTIVIEDQGNDHAGAYRVSLLNLTAGPLTSGNDPDGGLIVSGEVRLGQTGAVADMDAFRLSGGAGQRIVFGGLSTGGAGYDTRLYLYPPGGGPVISSNADRGEFQLTASGTWTIVVEDQGQDLPGSYSLSYVNVTVGPYATGNDPDGGPIASAEIRAGQTHSPTDFDAFTFGATAGDRVLIAGVATTGAPPYNTVVSLYPPGGGPAETVTFGDRLDHPLAATGTYTILIEDQDLDHTGTYSLSLLNLTAGPLTTPNDPDGGPIASGESRVGTTNTLGDVDAFQFSGGVGQRVVLCAVATAAAPYNTQIYLYPPSGPAVIASSSDRAEYLLTAAGTWTIVIEDVGQDHTGSYRVGLLNVTAGPLTTAADPDGGPIASAVTRAGQMNDPADFDAYTFPVTAGDRVLIGGVATSGAPPFNTVLYLYPPNGGAAETVTFGDRLDLALTVTGTYTLLVEDQNNEDIGTYVLSFVNLTAGPLSSLSDPDGGTIGSGEVRTGRTDVVADLDAFRVVGGAGRRILIGAVATSGTSYNTLVYLYPPTGSPVVNTANDRVEYLLTAPGNWTIVIEDQGMDQTGNYSLSYLDITAGPWTTGPDPDGGPIASSEVKSGQMNGVPDFDAFRFTGTIGHRVVIGAVATAGVPPFNTVIYLYPPNGGGAATVSFSDRVEHLLDQSGTWTILIEDQNLDHTGSYGVTLLDVTSGPFVDAADGDGGLIFPGAPRSGTIATVPDLDGFRFGGSAGDTAFLSAVARSGSLNTNLSLYPPGGGGAVVSTSNDNVTYVLGVTGWYTVLVEDLGMDATGGYDLALAKSGAVVAVAEDRSDAPLDLVRALLLPPRPSPFSDAVTLTLSLPGAREARLAVYDVAGARVRVLADGPLAAGVHRFPWDGRDERGAVVHAGVYYARLEAGREVVTRKLVRVR